MKIQIVSDLHLGSKVTVDKNGMKIQVESDLHLEDGSRYTVENAGADVLVLAGDIGDVGNVVEVLSDASKSFDEVVYVLGNHEFYGGDLWYTKNDIEEMVPYSNIHILNNEVVYLENTRFIGCTLWTDFSNGNPVVMEHIRQGLWDYRMIKYGDSQLLPSNILLEHTNSKTFLEEQLNLSHAGKTVVVTHHAPSYQSITPYWRQYTKLNPGFYSNMDELVEKSDLWIHGHTHSSLDYSIGKARVVCNPKGYRSDLNKEFKSGLIVEV